MWGLSSIIGDQICGPCIGGQILNQWTTRGVPWALLKPPRWTLWASTVETSSRRQVIHPKWAMEEISMKMWATSREISRRWWCPQGCQELGLLLPSLRLKLPQHRTDCLSDRHLFSQFWRLKVQDQGASMVGFFFFLSFFPIFFNLFIWLCHTFTPWC